MQHIIQNKFYYITIVYIYNLQHYQLLLMLLLLVLLIVLLVLLLLFPNSIIDFNYSLLFI